MKKSIYVLALLFISLLISCSEQGKKTPSLTGQQIEAYLKSYKELREKAPEMLKQANSGIGLKSSLDFESITKNNGLSYKDFVIINAKVGAIYSILQGENFMGEMEAMKKGGLVQMDEGMKQMQAQIDDPNTPEDAKKELRKAMEEMKASKVEINSEYDKNKEWADLVMNKTKDITNLFIEKEDTELVKQYFEKITEAYTGGVVPTNFKVSEEVI